MLLEINDAKRVPRHIGGALLVNGHFGIVDFVMRQLMFEYVINVRAFFD